MPLRDGDGDGDGDALGGRAEAAAPGSGAESVAAGARDGAGSPRQWLESSASTQAPKVTHRPRIKWPSIICGFSSGDHARRFRVLASFSLRSDAHVLKYCPWEAPTVAWSSRKPRQKPELGERVVLSVWR